MSHGLSPEDESRLRGGGALTGGALAGGALTGGALASGALAGGALAGGALSAAGLPASLAGNLHLNPFPGLLGTMPHNISPEAALPPGEYSHVICASRRRCTAQSTVENHNIIPPGKSLDIPGKR